MSDEPASQESPVTEPSPPEASAIVSMLRTKHAVHLVVSVDGDWDGARAETVAEAERYCDAAQAFADGDVFRTRYPGRVGVVRLLTKYAPPDIVSQVLTERGVEIEVTSASQQGDGRCSYCHRDKLSDQQVSMTDEGWACPSCFRAWLLRQQSDKPRERSIVSKLSSRLIFPLLLVVVALFILGVLHELRRLNQASNIIRQHMPTQ